MSNEDARPGTIDVIWYGRGGQGAFTASRILGAAYALGEGGDAIAFPSFGPERRGAPVRAFTKLSPFKVRDRSEVGSADYHVYLDPGMMDAVPENGTVIVNSDVYFDNSRILNVDCSRVASEVLGSNIVNTAMVGVLAAVWGGVSLDSVRVGIESIMPERLWDRNMEVVRRAYGEARSAS